MDLSIYLPIYNVFGEKCDEKMECDCLHEEP